MAYVFSAWREIYLFLKWFKLAKPFPRSGVVKQTRFFEKKDFETCYRIKHFFLQLTLAFYKHFDLMQICATDYGKRN